MTQGTVDGKLPVRGVGGRSGRRNRGRGDPGVYGGGDTGRGRLRGSRNLVPRGGSAPGSRGRGGKDSGVSVSEPSSSWEWSVPPRPLVSSHYKPGRRGRVEGLDPVPTFGPRGPYGRKTRPRGGHESSGAKRQGRPFTYPTLSILTEKGIYWIDREVGRMRGVTEWTFRHRTTGVRKDVPDLHPSGLRPVSVRPTSTVPSLHPIRPV